MENSPSFERFKDLDLSREEIDRLGEALKKDEFRKLLIDYVNEVQDPENQKLYEDEITELERERGNDITFLHPTPCYVIKTIYDGDKKCFINICGNDLVKKPSSTPSEKDGARGLQWSLPHSLSPPSEDLDNKGERCKVFDVLFHPDTLHLALKNNAFRNMVNNTACSAIETHFDVELDKNNLRFPKLKYKGMARASVIRKPSSKGPVERSPEEKEFYDKLYAQADESTQSYKTPKKSKRSKRKNTQDPKSPYTTPKFLIKHRRHVEMEEFTEHKESKLNTTIPKELIVEIDLPLLKSADDIILDVTEKTVQLISEKPAKYKLDLTLPYRVGKDAGSAKFDKTLGKLFITLPVQKPTYRRDFTREDSGVDSDHSSPLSPESEDEKSASVDNKSESKRLVNEEQFRTKFLEDEVQYSLPEFTTHVFDDTVAFTLHVKNVDSESLKQLIDEKEKSVHVKFVTVSPSFYQSHYAFMLKLPVESIRKDSVSVEVWDNNVILKVPFENCDNNECTWFMYGLSESEMQKKFLEEPHILNAIHKQTSPSIPPETEKSNNEGKDLGTEATKPQEISKSVQESNNFSYYESSGDELSCSLSPCRSRGILKRSSMRKTFSRSISESSLDDCIGSLDPEGLDIPIPEDNNEHEAEMSTSLKKTVRFNDVVSKQLYRFNSSILGQRKKNQKKAQKKKKAHEKKCSESEASEVEEKKEKFLKPQSNCDLSSEKSSKRDENIFQMDILPRKKKMLPLAMFGGPAGPAHDQDQDFLIKNGDHYGTKFLRDGIWYTFPKYLCIISNKKNKITFNLLVEDVLPCTKKVMVDDDDRSVSAKFCVITLEPHEAKHYAFMVKLPVLSIEDAEMEIQEKKVVLTITFQPDDEELAWYLCGKTDSELKKKTVENYELRIDDTSFEDNEAPAGSGEEEELDEDHWQITEL